MVDTIGMINGNLQNTLKDKKVSKSFMLNYDPLQKGIQKQMEKIDSSHAKIHKDTLATEKGIASIKKGKKRPGFLSLLLGGITPILFIALGGIIIVALMRLALKKWSDTYMPKPSGNKTTIFGIPIPGWDTIKAIG